MQHSFDAVLSFLRQEVNSAESTTSA